MEKNGRGQRRDGDEALHVHAGRGKDMRMHDEHVGHRGERGQTGDDFPAQRAAAGADLKALVEPLRKGRHALPLAVAIPSEPGATAPRTDYFLSWCRVRRRRAGSHFSRSMRGDLPSSAASVHSKMTSAHRYPELNRAGQPDACGGRVNIWNDSSYPCRRTKSVSPPSDCRLPCRIFRSTVCLM